MESSRNDPAYLAEVLSQKRQDDPKELAIREKIRDAVLREPWAREAFEKVRALQARYLKEAIAHLGDPAYIHDLSQRTLKEMCTIIPSVIVGGQEHLAQDLHGRPVLLATNHFGSYKLLGLKTRVDLGIDIPGYEDIYPFLGYFAALSPVAEQLGSGLYYSSNDFPGVFGEIHSDSGFIHVPALKEGRTAALIEQTRRAITERPSSAIVIFPEGTTSGKPTGEGPYALNQFKTGAYVIAAELGLPVVSVAQYFDPASGFKLKVFPAVVPGKMDKAGFEALAASQQAEMQQWLDQVQKA